MENRLTYVALGVIALSLPQPTQAAVDCAAYFDGGRFTMVVPYRAGGGYDTYARALASVFEEETGATFVVVNVPAAGGTVGVRQVIDAASDDRTIGFFGFTNAYRVSEVTEDPSMLIPTAAVNIETSVWLTRSGIDFEQSLDDGLIGGGDTLVGQIPRMGIPAKALGAGVSIVPGYEGTGELNAAILRGEIDFHVVSLSTALRHISDGEFEIAMVLSDKPVEDVDAPYLAGPGGLVERRSADLSSEEQKLRADYARMAVDVSTSARALWIGHNAEEEARTCLIEASERVALGEDFLKAAMAVGRPVNALGHQELAPMYTSFIKSSSEILEVVEKLRPEFE